MVEPSVVDPAGVEMSWGQTGRVEPSGVKSSRVEVFDHYQRIDDGSTIITHNSISLTIYQYLLP